MSRRTLPNHPSPSPISPDPKSRASRLGLHGLVAHWDDVAREPWLASLLDREEAERHQRSLERRIHQAKLGHFKPMADFEWDWPKEIARDLVEELFQLQFLAEHTNVILVGPNGVGKTMIAQNLAHQAICKGHTALRITASELLNDLAAQDAGAALLRRLRRYSRPDLLVIDEVGYLASSNRHGDLLFEIVTRRYQVKSIVITTNKAFTEWNSVFPSAGCVTTLVDRLTHNADIVKIAGESYRLKDSNERKKAKELQRKSQRRRPAS